MLRDMLNFMENTSLLNLLIFLNLMIGLSAIFCNALVWSFYRSKHDNITHFLYFILSSVDMASGITPILHAALLLVVVRDSQDSVAVLLPMVYYLTAIASRLSVFIATVIAVIRTLNIALPFYQVRKPVVLVFLFLYTLWWFVFLSGDMVDFNKNGSDVTIAMSVYFLFYLAMPTPGYYFTDRIWSGLGLQLNHGYNEHLVYTGVPFILPTVICIICMCIIAWRLVIKKQSNSSNNDVNKHITITILLLTIVFVVCNILFISIFYGSVISHSLQGEFMTEADFFSAYFAINMLPFINSVINPVILIFRGRSLNQFVWRLLCRDLLCRGIQTASGSMKGSKKISHVSSSPEASASPSSWVAPAPGGDIRNTEM